MRLRIFRYKNVTSTNDMAIKLIKENKKEFGYVCAETQTKGRGTHGKKWISIPGNLFGSLFFPLKKSYPPFNEFSIINPIIISNVIKKFCEKSEINLKFPNDILINGKKICGILQELIILNNKRFLIIGIGLNTISDPKIKKKYKSSNIFYETKKKPKTEELMKLIILSYENFFKNLKSYNYSFFKKKAEFMSISK